MKTLKLNLIALTGAGVILFGGCASNQPENTIQTQSDSAAKPAGETNTKTETSAEKEHSHGDKKAGGQVVNLGQYHLEFNPDIQKDSTHLDMNLHGDQDQEITDAKLTAQIQLPDGTKKTLPIPYNTEEKQYTAKLPETATGDYKVVIQTDLKGEKLNGRFSFNRTAKE